MQSLRLVRKGKKASKAKRQGEVGGPIRNCCGAGVSGGIGKYNRFERVNDISPRWNYIRTLTWLTLC